jgi:hypothetical protein
MEQVFIRKITITKKEQQYFFQITLPKNVQQIIGIETGVRLKTVLKKRKPRRLLPIRFGFYRNTPIGMLQLKAMGTNQTIYTNTISLTDNNIGMDDLVSKVIPNEKMDNPKDTKELLLKQWISNVHTHCARKEEDTINVCGVHTLYGSFTDVLGKQLVRDIEYTVQLYIWTNETTTL